MTTLFRDVFHYFFRKKTIVFLGRAGLHCYYKGEKYFVDSEILVSPLYDIVVYSDRIYLISRGNKLTVDETTKSNVLTFLKMELEKRHIKFEFS